MPGGFPFGDICNAQSSTDGGGQSVGYILAVSASNNTKGAYSQIIASTAADICFLTVSILAASGAGAGVGITEAVDIAIGAAGSEIVLIPNLIAANGANVTSIVYSFPLSIPNGTRISARFATSNIAGSPTCGIMICGYDGGFTQSEGFAGVDAIGFNSGTTLGTAVTASGTADVKGGYSQLIASTARDYMGLALGADFNNVSSGNASYLFDVAIGAAGAEQIITANVQIYAQLDTTWVNGWSPAPLFLPICIPAGTRLSARCQNITASAVMGLTLYGLY